MNKYFPSISRRITEPLTFVLLILVFVLIAVSLKNLNDYRKFKSERALVEKDIEKWKNVVSEKPDYRDAYLELAILEYRVGDINQSNFYLEKALILDPNFKQGLEFQKFLQK